jgi:hypothetical protein
MTDRNRRGSITMWAWILSTVAHLVLLAVFAMVHFSLSVPGPSSAPATVVTLAQIEQVTSRSEIFPKPKVKSYLLNYSGHGPQSMDFPPRGRIETIDRPNKLPQTLVPDGIGLLAGEAMPDTGVRFFGQSTDLRKICYVVDCSGSMQGLFGRVLKQLKNSIAGLQPDRYFYIIFFGAEHILESGRGRLVRATPKSKSSACAFIDSIRPGGTTNAAAALEHAMRVRDSQGKAPEMIYFLTDGLDLDSPDTAGFASLVENIRKNLAPAAKINTIGFWTQRDDCEVLRAVARRSGGEFTNIN